MDDYKDTIFYSFLRPIIYAYMKIIYRPKVINRQLIPNNKRIILAGNHTSILDSLLLISITKRHIHFLAKKELFSGIKGIIFNNLGLISVDREAKDKKDVLIKATKYLENDKVIGIFPEGTTEKDNYPNLLPFKNGAVKLSKDTSTEIIPFKIIGRYKPFKKSVKIIFKEPFKANSDINKSNKDLYNIINEIKDINGVDDHE